MQFRRTQRAHARGAKHMHARREREKYLLVQYGRHAFEATVDETDHARAFFHGAQHVALRGGRPPVERREPGGIGR